MDESTQRELKMLIDKRWDPRRGVSPLLGTIRAWLTGAFLILMVFGRYIIVALPISPAWNEVIFVPPIGLIVCWLIPIGIRKRTKRRVLKHDWFLCPWCRYALTGLADQGVCPECGAGYRKDVCAKLYQYAYKAYQPDPHVLKGREAIAWREAIELREQFKVNTEKER